MLERIIEVEKEMEDSSRHFCGNGCTACGGDTQHCTQCLILHGRDLQHENDQMRDVLAELIERNNLRGDLDVYLLNLCEWGMGKANEKPNPDDFGV